MFFHFVDTLSLSTTRFDRHSIPEKRTCLEEIRHPATGCGLQKGRWSETGEGFELAHQMWLIGKTEVTSQGRPVQRFGFSCRRHDGFKSDNAREDFGRNS